MTSYMVNYNTVQQVIQEFDAATNQITTIVDDVNSTAQSQLGFNNWEGSAQQEYLVCQKNWNAASADMQRLLGQATKALDNIAQNYNLTDNKNASSFGAVG